ncbi:MAG: hypothetical protein ABI946_08635 [Chthoniobacterales bacterium]
MNYHVTGDALAFTKLMNENFDRALAPPWVGVKALWDNLQDQSARDFVTVGLAEIAFTLCSVSRSRSGAGAPCGLRIRSG